MRKFTVETNKPKDVLYAIPARNPGYLIPFDIVSYDKRGVKNMAKGAGCPLKEIREFVPKEALDKALERLDILASALNQIACWSDGPVVTNRFDSPGDAQTARDALAEAGRVP